MSPQFSTQDSDPRPDQLSAGYAQLRDVDVALREAEQQLSAAHRDFASRQGPRPDSIYREVVRLRQLARTMLDQLADMFVGEEPRGSRLLSEKQPRQ